MPLVSKCFRSRCLGAPTVFWGPVCVTKTITTCLAFLNISWFRSLDMSFLAFQAKLVCQSWYVNR